MSGSAKPKLNIPKPLLYVMVIGIVGSWVPLAFIARARAVKSPEPRIHIFQDMDIQPKYVAQDSHDEMENGAAMRLPVTGTVAHGHLQGDDHFYRGYQTDDRLVPKLVKQGDKSEPAYFMAFPKSIKVDSALLKLGRQQYDIFCAVCHGHAGYGDGLVHRRALKLKSDAVVSVYKDKNEPDPAGGWVNPANLHGDGFKADVYPNGKLFDMITRGKPVVNAKTGKVSHPMPSYRSQISAHDRWAVVAYIRALQWSQNMPVEHVPDALMAQLPPAPPKATLTASSDPGVIAQGKTLFQTKICFTCHQADPNVPAPAGLALKAPPFVGKFWGTEREVHVGGPGGPVKKVVLDDAYFVESVKKPMAKIVKGSIPGMVVQPMKDEEIVALMSYVKSLSK